MTETYPMPQQQTEGANCADLPAPIFDKYFYSNGHTERFLNNTAKRICARCVVLEECRTAALASPRREYTVVVGGMTGSELRTAQRWIAYEHGVRDTPPDRARPDWLARSEAAETVEQARTELELGVER